VGEIWSEDGRRVAVYELPGQPAEWSDDPVPDLVRPETYPAWGWRVAVRLPDGSGETRPGPDSGARFPTRERALEDLVSAMNDDPELARLPVVDHATGESLEEDDSP
jgi:hypothetical protein